MRKPRVTARWVRSSGRSILDYHGTYCVKVDGVEVATVRHARDPFSENAKRRAGYWIFYGSHLGVTHNSAWKKKDWDTAEQARDACIEWVKGVIDEHRKRADSTPAASGDSSGGEAPGGGGPGNPGNGG